MNKKRIRVLRLWYLCGIIELTVLGLLSRKIGAVPDFCGDALWAMMVYCCWRIVLTGKPLFISAAAALITSYLDEFSQMLTPDWLVKLRSTFLGHMLLGQGFLWSDLLAYTVGIAVIYSLTALIKLRITSEYYVIS